MASSRPDHATSMDAQPPEIEELAACEFAGPGPLREQLVAAVLRGEKTATSSLLAEYQHEPLPTPGERFRVVDSEGANVAVIETTSISITPLAAIDLQFARDEGEGFASVAQWRQAHEEFWRSTAEELGIELGDETLVVAERFRLVS